MSKDYIRHLFALLADGKTADFTRQGEEALKEIEKEIADAQAQADVIRKALARHGTTSVEPRRVPAGAAGQRASAPGLDHAQRQAIHEAAVHLATRTPNAEITVGDVLEAVSKQGMTLTVAKPGAVVGSMLSKWKDFTKTAEGKYRIVTRH